MEKNDSHCGASGVEVDDEGKLEANSNCGMVCDEGIHHTNAKLQGEITSGTFAYSHFRVVHNSTFVTAKECLDEQAERLRLPKEYIIKVEENLKTLYAEQLYRGLPRNRKAFVGSCIYIVCRQNDMVLTLSNVAEAAQCKLSTLARCVRLLTKKMNVQLGSIEPNQIITNILLQFDIQDPSTEKLVYDLFEFCSKTMICLGKRNDLTVMALVFMSTESTNLETLSQKKIEEVCNLNSVKLEHVRKFVRLYRAELFKLAKKIPWISATLTPKQVPKILKDILEYYKDCEDFHNVDFKPQWLERKEQIEKERNTKD